MLPPKNHQWQTQKRKHCLHHWNDLQMTISLFVVHVVWNEKQVKTCTASSSVRQLELGLLGEMSQR